MKKFALMMAAMLALLLLAPMTAAAPEIPVLHEDQATLIQAGGFPLTESTTAITAQSGGSFLHRFLSGRSSTNEEAVKRIREGYLSMSDSIDLRAFALTAEQLKSILQDMINASPELFHVEMQYKYYLSGTTVDSLIPTYNCTKEEYALRSAAYEEELTRLLALRDDSWSDTQTVLFYHDYLASRYSYDTAEPINYDAYHFLTEKTGVCQAYTLTMIALLQRADIPVSYAQSSAMDHIWNLVMVEDEWYHVDITWDDPTPDIVGGAKHTLLLLSDTAMQAENHRDWITPNRTVCASSRFDHADWRDVDAPMAMTENQLFGIDRDGNLCAFTLETGMAAETVIHISDRWQTASGEQYVNSFSKLVGGDAILYYSTPKALMAIDPISRMTYEIHTVSENEGSVYDLIQEDGVCYYALAADPHSAPQYRPFVLPLIPLPNYAMGVHLYAGKTHIGSFANVAGAIRAMNDPDTDYLIAFSIDMPGAVYSIGTLSIPSAGAASVTMRPMHPDITVSLALGRTFDLGADLHLENISLISAATDSSLTLGEHGITLSGKASIGSKAAPITLSGNGSSFLTVNGTEEETALYAGITVGRVDLSGNVSLQGHIRTSTLRISDAAALSFPSSGSSLTTADLIGAEELVLRPRGDTPPTIGISGITDVLLRYIYPSSYGAATLLTAPALPKEDLVVIFEESGTEIDVTALFTRSETGALYLESSSKMTISGNTLTSYLSVIPNDRVVLPPSITAVSAYAFVRCPNVVSVLASAAPVTFGPYALGYIYRGGTLVRNENFRIRCPEGAPIAAYAKQNGIPLDAFREEENSEFTYRYYPDSALAELLTWKGSGGTLIIPEFLTTADGVRATTAVDGDLAFGRTGLSIFSPYPKDSPLCPYASSWQQSHSYYPKGAWHTLTLMLDGAVLSRIPMPQGANPAEILTTPSRPTTPDVTYRFAGWDSDADGIPDPVPTEITANLTLSAIFEALENQFLVSWYDENGKLLFDQAFAAGAPIVPPADPEKAPSVSHTFTFAGWEGFVPGMSATENRTFTATYTAIPRTYTLTFLDDMGNVIHTETLPYGSPISPITPPSKPNEGDYAFTFSHWNGYTVGMLLTGDCTLSAVYTRTDLSGAYPDDITSSRYTVSGGTIAGVAPGTTLHTFLSFLDQASFVTVTRENGAALEEDDVVGTGMRVTLRAADGSPTKQLTVVVTGDLSGDGEITVTDFIGLKAHLLYTNLLTDARADAADMNGDGKVTLTDFILIKAALLRAIA